MNPLSDQDTVSEEEIERLENEFPLRAAAAFAAARRQALEAGLSVVESEGDALYRVFPDGRKEFLKKLEPPIRVDSWHDPEDQVSGIL